jgi:hypothetical protein
MKEKLKNNDNKKFLFSATVSKFGLKSNRYRLNTLTILLVDIKFEDGNFACDHSSFTVRKTMGKLNLNAGDKITFEAKISKYTKGYTNYYNGIEEYYTDLKLNRPTKIKKIN